jgi:hypoxanthine phosphoribosyltransferase
MKTRQVLGKKFAVSIPAEEIAAQVRRVAGELNRDMADKNPIFLAVLNGSFVFAADLMREITVPSEISFVKMSSYSGTSSTGEMTKLIGLNGTVEGRTVVVVEDIIDSGFTMVKMIEMLQEMHPADIKLCTLLLKPGNLKVDLTVDYNCFSIPNDFIVGYGLDYNEQGRNLKDIYTVVEE